MNEGECEAQVFIPAAEAYKCGRDKGHSPLMPHRATLPATGRSESDKLADTVVTIEWKDSKE